MNKRKPRMLVRNNPLYKPYQTIYKTTLMAVTGYGTEGTSPEQVNALIALFDSLQLTSVEYGWGFKRHLVENLGDWGENKFGFYIDTHDELDEEQLNIFLDFGFWIHSEAQEEKNR